MMATCGVALAGLAFTGCAEDQDQLPTDSATVSVCVSEDPSQVSARAIEVRQGGDVVGAVSLRASGTAGIEVPPGPLEVYLDGKQVGSGDVGAGGTITIPCDTTSTSSDAETTSG